MGKQVADVKDSTDAQTGKTDNRNSAQRFHFQEKNNLYLSHQKSISKPYFTHHFIFHPTMRKQRLLLALCSLTLAVFFLDSCRKLVKNEAYYLAISKYVYAYTSGAIGRSDAGMRAFQRNVNFQFCCFLALQSIALKVII